MTPSKDQNEEDESIEISARNQLKDEVVDVVKGATLFVRGLDCLDETPLLDIKPDRSIFVPIAPPTPGDSDTGGGRHHEA